MFEWSRDVRQLITLKGHIFKEATVFCKSRGIASKVLEDVHALVPLV